MPADYYCSVGHRLWTACLRNRKLVSGCIGQFQHRIQLLFQPYSPNTPHLVTSMLMMCRRSSMVHLLISLLLLAALMLSLKICTSGCLPTGYRSIQTRRNLSGLALPSNFRSLTSLCSQKDFPPLPFTPVFETLA